MQLAGKHLQIQIKTPENSCILLLPAGREYCLILCMQQAFSSSNASAQEALECPCCGKPLYVEQLEPVGVVLYCPWSQCECEELGDGAAGLTMSDAWTQLNKVFEMSTPNWRK